MIKNRTAQLMFQSAFCAVGIIGIVASFGFFDMVWRWDFYIQFTNISNYFCFAVMIVELIQTAKKKENSFVSALPLLKFIGVLSILLTFIVFNFFIAKEATRDPVLNFKINSVTFHVILPVMYILDWLLFYEKKKVRITYPLISVLFPLCYGIFIFIHAALYRFDSSVLNFFGTGPFIYPYFFLNIDTYGVGGVCLWLLGLGAVFVGVGFIFYAIDRLCFRLQKRCCKNNLAEIIPINERDADIEVLFEFNGTRNGYVADGYRPLHLITDDCLTTGAHHYYDVQTVLPDATAKGTITFISPEAYPHSLWVGKRLNIQEGEKIVGYATVLKIFNPILSKTEDI